MARYKVKWRDVFWLSTAIPGFVSELDDLWEDAKKQVKDMALDPSSPLGRLYATLDTFYRELVRRFRRD